MNLVPIAFAHGLVLGAILASTFFILGRLCENKPQGEKE